MDEVLRGLDFCYVYIDDVLIASENEEEHYDHLQQVFARLQQYGAVINVAKSTFCTYEVTFLGYTVDKDGTRPPKDRVVTITDFKRPDTVKQLRRYLGMVNFYRRFIQGAAIYFSAIRNVD